MYSISRDVRIGDDSSRGITPQAYVACFASALSLAAALVLSKNATHVGMEPPALFVVAPSHCVPAATGSTSQPGCLTPECCGATSRE